MVYEVQVKQIPEQVKKDLELKKPATGLCMYIMKKWSRVGLVVWCAFRYK